MIDHLLTFQICPDLVLGDSGLSLVAFKQSKVGVHEKCQSLMYGLI